MCAPAHGQRSTRTPPSWPGRQSSKGPRRRWGISTGKSASLQAGPWLAAGGKQLPDLATIFGPVNAVLYRMEWGGGVTTHVSIICQNDESAAALSQLLTIFRSARPAAGGGNSIPEGLFTLLQGLDVRASGPRVELTTMAPFSVIDQLMRGGAG